MDESLSVRDKSKFKSIVTYFDICHCNVDVAHHGCSPNNNHQEWMDYSYNQIELADAIQGSKIQSTFTSFQAIGKFNEFSTPFHRGCPMMRKPTNSTGASCQDYNTENWKVVTPEHTCFFGEEMELANGS
eukprot:3467976-Ditylum_brightwellii.AAC.4